MKATWKQNHFDVITSKFRQNRIYCVGQVFFSVTYPPPMNNLYFHLTELRTAVHTKSL